MYFFCGSVFNPQTEDDNDLTSLFKEKQISLFGAAFRPILFK